MSFMYREKSQGDVTEPGSNKNGSKTENGSNKNNFQTIICI